MEESILKSTKKILGLDADYTPFDLDVITHINAAFSILNQLGVGPETGFHIEDETQLWADYNVPDNQLHLVKTYVYLKVRILFDPPATSYLITAATDQLKEYEWRLNVFREYELYPPSTPVVEPHLGEGVISLNEAAAVSRRNAAVARSRRVHRTLRN
jgi:hypothetical protein